MRRYLHPGEGNLDVHSALGPLDYAATCFRTKLLKAEKKATTVSVVKGGKRGMSYISVEPDAKSTRERYIRVATIDIIVNEGTWNICVDGESVFHEGKRTH